MDTKKIVLDILIKKVESERPKKKRVVTQHRKWNFDECALDPQYQTRIVQDLLGEGILDISGGGGGGDGEKTILQEPTHVGSIPLIKQQIHRKIQSYSVQDKEKGLYDPLHLVTYTWVLEMFRQSNMKCYYCKEPTLILYEHVRNPKQWTLERLDNSLGHIKENVVISCLHCNLRRRTMHTDRYMKTTEMRKVVKIDSAP